jgi:hypothetical protein
VPVPTGQAGYLADADAFRELLASLRYLGLLGPWPAQAPPHDAGPGREVAVPLGLGLDGTTPSDQGNPEPRSPRATSDLRGVGSAPRRSSGDGLGRTLMKGARGEAGQEGSLFLAAMMLVSAHMALGV